MRLPSFRARINRMTAARVAVVILLSCVFVLPAHSATPGHLTIQVTDRSGVVLPGAQIRIYVPQNNGTPYQFNTDVDGRAVIDLAPGNYTLWIAAQGFEQYRQDDLQVIEDGSQVFQISLPVGTFGARWINLASDSLEPYYAADFSIPLEHLDVLPIRPKRVHKKHLFF